MRRVFRGWARLWGNFFSALFSGHKVLRHVLQPQGGTFASRDEDFLACDNVAFHPTDVLEDADGSLLVIETGGWYQRCCPSSTFYRPDVSGGDLSHSRTARRPSPILAARSLRSPRFRPNDWLRCSMTRPVVRRRAIERLGELGGTAIVPLRAAVSSAASPEGRCRRFGRPRASTATRPGKIPAAGELDDRDEVVRHAALSSISLWRDRAAFAQLVKLVGASTPQDRRTAAEALGRLRDRAAVPALLAHWQKPTIGLSNIR